MSLCQVFDCNYVWNGSCMHIHGKAIPSGIPVPGGVVASISVATVPGVVWRSVNWSRHVSHFFQNSGVMIITCEMYAMYIRDWQLEALK